jgi:simple sugar transport system ATP-binding protein
MKGDTLQQARASQTATPACPSVRLGAVDVFKAYGSVRANDGISLSVGPGEIHAVVGENGAGKSTLMRILQGLEKPDSGSVVVDDTMVRLSHPQQALNLGIGMVHQEFMLAPDLTLLENFVLGVEPVDAALGPVSRIDWQAARRSGESLAGEAGVRIDWDRRAGSAPVHVQQFVEIIRLLRRGARILILDEPTAVLAPPQVEDLFALLRELRRDGTTILFISHKLREVMALADHVTVIRRGRVTFTSAVADTQAETVAGHIIGDRDPAADLGGDEDRRPGDRAERPVVLSARGITAPSVDKSHALSKIGFEIRGGEIVGLAGVAGNGQDELVECLVGLRHIERGTLRLRDHDITGAGNAERRRRGLSFVSPDRAHEGLATTATVAANAIAGSHRTSPIGRGPFLDLAAMKRVATGRLERLGVTYGRRSDPVASLSGGNQQRLVFARETAGEPSLMVVAQPTRGVDLNGIAAIHRILREFRNAGGSVFLVSEELDELLDLSDRILVIADGRIVGEQDGRTADIAEIGRMMVLQGRGDD